MNICFQQHQHPQLAKQAFMKTDENVEQEIVADNPVSYAVSEIVVIKCSISTNNTGSHLR